MCGTSVCHGHVARQVDRSEAKENDGKVRKAIMVRRRVREIKANVRKRVLKRNVVVNLGSVNYFLDVSPVLCSEKRFSERQGV